MKIIKYPIILFFIFVTIKVTYGQVFWGQQQSVTTIADGANSVFAYDIDDDGDIDLISASNYDNKIAWYENTDGNGTFGSQRIITITAEGAVDVFACYVDDDDYIDIISVSSLDDKVAWYKNIDGNGNFGVQQIISTAADWPTAIFAADLDNDGYIDIISASRNDDKIAWYKNDGTGNFDTQAVISIEADWASDVFAYDINGNGYIDVISTSRNDNKIAWYENDGAGNFGEQIIISTETDEPTSIFVCDIDNDNDSADIISASFFDDKIAWYTNDGNGNFDEQDTVTIDCDEALGVYACNINKHADNLFDVISASWHNDEIAWYKNLGSEGFSSKIIVSTEADCASDVIACDIDGDGDNDIVSASFCDDKIAWYENNPKPIVTIQPENKRICEGSNTSFSTLAEYTSSYMWHVINSEGGFVSLSTGGVYAGTDSSTMTITNATTNMNGYIYCCIVSNPSKSDTCIQVTLLVDEIINSNAGADTSICDISEYELQANEPSPGNGIWTATENINFSDITLHNTTVSGLPIGETIFTWTISNATCGSNFSNISITRYETIIANAGEDNEICDSIKYDLSGNIPLPGTGLWSSTTENVDFINPSIYNTDGINLPAGKIDFIWTITNGACGSNSDTVSVIKYETIMALAGEDDLVCDSSSYQFSANSPQPGYGLWTCENEDIIFDNISLFNATVSNLPEEIISFTWTITNGVCGYKSDSILVQISHTPIFDLQKDIELCEEQTYTYNVTDGYDSYFWQDNSTNTYFTTSNKGWYTIRVTNVCATVTDSTYLTVHPLPLADAGADFTVCLGDTITLTAGTGVDYTWDNDVIQSVPFIAVGTQTYNVNVISEYGCADNDNITVYVNSLPEIIDIDTESPNQILVEAYSDAMPLRYFLNKGDYQTNGIFTYLATGDYVITVINANNCLIKSESIYIEHEVIINIPTVFTPNNDGYNDTWENKDLANELPDAEIFIYDRYGKIITQYKATEGSWDGTYNGKNVQADTYWYVIRLTTREIFKGYITVLR